MIANHKQEVELMNLLREKEKDRQKYSLASKVADRKRKRLNKKAELLEKEGLKHGQVSMKDSHIDALLHLNTHITQMYMFRCQSSL